MKLTCVIEEPGRTRQVEARDFPLALGGKGADIAVPGLETGGPGAFLALADGELFVQPQGSTHLSLAGAPVTASQWLHDGDDLRLLATRVHVARRGDGLRLRVEHLRLDQPTEPPAFTAPAAAPAPQNDALVHPAAYRPRPLPLGEKPGRRRLHLRPQTVAAGLALLLAAGFLLAARTVEVRVEPDPERLSVKGWPHLAFGRVRLLLPGRYTVVAERPGYRRLEAALAVTRERQQVARFTLERLPGRLALETTPARGVRVLVDGDERGATPLEPLEVPGGEHDVVLRAEGYAAFATRVAIVGGGEEQTLRATLVPDRASVSFASEPVGAAVRVDGVEVGRTPLAVELTSGTRTVEVTLAGFKPAGRRIEVVAEHPLTVPLFRLEPLPGLLALTSEPARATVSVDGEFRGETPLELPLPPRKAQVLRLTKAGYETAEASVTLEPGEARSLSLALAPRLGDVEVAAEPPDAEVVVDGESRGRAGQTFRLTAVPHEIEVRRPGYEPHRVTLTPRPGFPQTVRTRLRSTEEAKTAARPALLRVQGHELRLLGPGRFQMGASRREPGRRANETLREVELVRPYYLALREVTNAQFRRFKPDHSSGRLGNYDLAADHLPVVQITWEQAAEYCNWLSAQEGLSPAYVVRNGKLVGAQPLGTAYRLPTEAEWSRAARYPGEGPLKYPWGNALPVPPRAGNYADEAARAIVAVVLQGYDDHYPVSAPVGSFPPNALGFFDFGGNAAEWVHDVYGIPPADAPPQRDPLGPAAGLGPASGDLHVILGSSYLQGTVTELRLSYRDYATKPRPDVGFRPARYAE